MSAILSVQGASAPVKKKSFLSTFTRLNLLKLARAVIPAAVLIFFSATGNGCRRFAGPDGQR